MPDAEQDQGTHAFSWAVLPHVGHFLQSNVPQAAYLFNSPLHLRLAPGIEGAGELISRPPFRVHGAPNVLLETVKRGDDDAFGKLDKNTKGTTTIILRIYEAFGGHARALLHVSSAFSVSKAYSTNLLEDDLEELNIFRGRDGQDDIEIKLDFRGFEIKTVKLVLGKVNHDDLIDQSKRDSWVDVKLEKLSALSFR